MNDGNTAASSAFVRWTDILRQLKELYGQMLEAEAAKREAIRQNEINGIRTWSEREQQLLERFGELDRRRRDLMVEWQQERGLRPDPRATLSDVMAILDNGAEREVVRELKRQLTEAAGELKAAAQANRDLLQLSLDAVAERLGPGGDSRTDYIYGNPKDGPGGARRPSGYDIRM